ncbi:MAG TPA: glycosyltransferase family 39 protein [Pseudonocardiaceae bacterium]|nr:glycosyltransferase family 39 protein [Pseudonocardiaceae bacterium]
MTVTGEFIGDETDRTPRFRWPQAGLLGVLVLAALLCCWSLGDRGLQPYYAAAVHSMSRGATTFLFGGYDPAGLVTVDKTPLAFWVQTAGVWVFGYHWWAIALVQAIEGVAAVFVLHRIVRRWAGEGVALLAALLLAISPVNTAIDRDNVSDALLVLLVLLAAYCLTRAVEHGRTGWLIGAGVLVGLGFTTKMLAAWVVLPALALGYLPAPVPPRRKTAQLAAAGVVALAVSLAWPVFVSVWPGQRPYIGSTTNNSIWQLIFGYNGFGRVFGTGTGSLGSLGNTIGSGLAGDPGPLRLLNSALAGQIGWLLPVAVGAVLGAVIWWLRTRGGSASQRSAWLLWGGWLVLTVLVFSFAGGIFHRYYTAELAPAVAVVTAAGLAACWRWYAAGQRAGLVLPLAVAATAVEAFAVLDQTPDWLPWLRVAILVAGSGSALVLLAVFPGWRQTGVGLTPIAAIGLAAMLAGPAAYSIDTAGQHWDLLSASDPSAGPSTVDVAAGVGGALGTGPAARAYEAFMDGAQRITAGERQILAYATAHDNGAQIALAVEGGTFGADPYLINTDANVAALGGYLGFDQTPTTGQLADWTNSGRLRFVLLPRVFLEISQAAARDGAAASTASAGEAITERIQWTARHCAVVPPARIGAASATAGILFDCGR